MKNHEKQWKTTEKPWKTFEKPWKTMEIDDLGTVDEDVIKHIKRLVKQSEKNT